MGQLAQCALCCSLPPDPFRRPLSPRSRLPPSLTSLDLCGMPPDDEEEAPSHDAWPSFDVPTAACLRQLVNLKDLSLRHFRCVHYLFAAGFAAAAAGWGWGPARCHVHRPPTQACRPGCWPLQGRSAGGVAAPDGGGAEPGGGTELLLSPSPQLHSAAAWLAAQPLGRSLSRPCRCP